MRFYLIKLDKKLDGNYEVNSYLDTEERENQPYLNAALGYYYAPENIPENVSILKLIDESVNGLLETMKKAGIEAHKLMVMREKYE